MKRLSLFDKCTLALAGLCLALMVGKLALSTLPSQGWQVQVERTADPMENAQLWREGTEDDGLLEGEIMDLNTATASDLQRLPGIGQTRAEAIIAWREENGGFGSVDQMTKVKGIGKGTLESVRAYVAVGTGN